MRSESVKKRWWGDELKKETKTWQNGFQSSEEHKLLKMKEKMPKIEKN